MFRRKPTPPVNVEWIIAGLGNPGPEYAKTRHNVGFDLVDALADKHKIKIDRAKHKSRYGVGTIGGVGVVLVKPMTFMNMSGQALAPLLREFGLKPDRLLVVADELDLPVGKVRMKPKGGTAGHNGHKSIKHSLGTEEYPRIRIGINSENRNDTIDFVLAKFHPEERVDINQVIEQSIRGVEVMLADGVERAVNVINEGQ